MDVRNKVFDLEERTFTFAYDISLFIEKIPRTLKNTEYSKQLIRSASSVAANYIEANESLGRKDFFLHLKICRKEAKESRLWIRLMDLNFNENLAQQQKKLAQEAQELTLIFASILRKAGAIK